MILKKLSVSYFQAFGVNQTVTFDKGVYCIVGRNKDAGGSNGSGKTSLVRALNTAMLGSGYADVSSSDIKNKKYPQQKPMVEATFLFKEKELVVSRCVGGDFKFIYDGTAVEGKVSDVQDKLLNLLGLSADQLYFLTYKNQFSAANFLFMKDADKKDFLVDFFCKSKIEKLHNEFEAKVKLKQSELTALMTAASQLSGKLETTKSVLENLQQQYEKTPWEEEIRTLENRLQTVTERLNQSKIEANNPKLISAVANSEAEFLAQHVKLTEDIEALSYQQRQIASQIEDLSAKIDRKNSEHCQIKKNELERSLKNTIDLIKAKMSTKQNAEKALVELQKSETVLQSQVSLLQEQIKNHSETCHYCSQKIPHNMLGHIINQKMEELAKIEANLQWCRTKILEQQKAVQTLETELAHLETSKNELQENILQISIHLAHLESNQELVKLKQLENEMAHIQSNVSLKMKERELLHKRFEEYVNYQVNLCKQEIERDSKEIEITLKYIAYQKEKMQNLRTEIHQTQKQLENLQTEHANITNSLNMCKKECDILREAANVFSKNGFISFLFEDILKSLNLRINDLLQQIPIASQFKVDISLKNSDGLSKKDRAICFNLFDQNDMLVTLDSVSGAERQILALLVDTALDDILEERLGVSIGYKIYDEQFSWVDAYNKEFVLDFLKNHYINKTLIIIDHGSELNSSIENVIIVTKKDGESTVQSM